MKYSKELIESIFENREYIDILIEDKIERISTPEFLNEEDINSIEEIYESYDFEFPLEERVQIKRKYREYSSFNVNKQAPIRNRIVEFVGSRFVTETELKSFLTKLEEDRGNAIDNRKWFSRNSKYFESFQNRGQQVWTLSKYGKRIYEFIIKQNNQKQINESVGLFKF